MTKAVATRMERKDIFNGYLGRFTNWTKRLLGYGEEKERGSG